MEILLSILKWVLRIILRDHVITGKGNVRKDESSVFVCNHSGIHGPIAMELFFPYEFRPWVISDMIARKSCRVYMEKDLFKNAPAAARPFCRLVTAIIEPVVLWIMREVKAIPVYRGSKKIIETLEISADSLAAGGNVAIFLDNVENGDYAIQKDSGFVHLAREYYYKCGKALSFYPVYIDRKRREIHIGTPVTYHPANGLKEEEQRIMAILAEALRPR